MYAQLESSDGTVLEVVSGDERSIRARAQEVGAYCLTWLPDPPPTDPPTGEDGSYLPTWLEAGQDLFVDEDWWRLLYALGVDPGWSEGWQRGLLEILKTPHDGDIWASGEADVLACIQLLRWQGLHARTGKPLTSRSATIRHSLKSQLIEWLETPPPGRPFDSPYSAKQWKRCMRTKWNAYGSMRQRGNQIARWLHRLIEAGAEIWPAACRDLVPVYGDL